MHPIISHLPAEQAPCQAFHINLILTTNYGGHTIIIFFNRIESDLMMLRKMFKTSQIGIHTYHRDLRTIHHGEYK